MYNIDSVFLAEAQQGRLVDMKISLSRGANINAHDTTGETALHSVARYDRVECIEFLVKNGAYVDAKSISGRTPLHISVVAENIAATKLLVESGADINAKDEYDDTPLALINQLPDHTSDGQKVIHYLESVIENRTMDSLIIKQEESTTINF